MKCIIDRLEGDFAIVEYAGGKTAKIEKVLLAGCSEGDVISLEKDEQLTQQKKKEARNILTNLFQK